MGDEEETQQRESRQYGLDLLKLVCAFLVVYIHAGSNTGNINSISTIAVPVFFIISGYLYESVTLVTGKQWRQVIRLTKMFGSAFIFYCIWSGIILPAIIGASLQDVAVAAVKEQFSAMAIGKLILLNAPSYGYHLWYLSALAYTICFSIIADKTLSHRMMKFLVALLLMAGAVAPAAFGYPLRTEFVRNFIFEGIPMFYIGRYMSGGMGSRLDWREISQKQGNKAVVLILCIVSIVILCVEQRMYEVMDIKSALSPFIVLSSILLVYITLIYGNWIKSNKSSKVCKVLKNTGGLGTSVYIVHIFILSIINALFQVDDGLLKSVLCFSVSFILSWGLAKVKIVWLR